MTAKTQTQKESPLEWLKTIKNYIMEKEELEQYQRLTKFQKDVVDALINLGFKHKYFSTYELLGWGNVNVSKFSRWSDVLKYVHEQGKDQKAADFRGVLGI